MIAEALQFGVAALSSSSESARTDALLLLSAVTGLPREWLVAHPDAALNLEQRGRFATICGRRRHGVPIAYLLGSADFYGREFLVNESVLVPRPETEHLVDEALRFINDRRERVSVLDIGTGCGAIACSIAAESSAHVDATDISEDALAIARKNATRFGLADDCHFHQGDLAEPVVGNRYDAIVANLPYIPTADLPRPPSPASFEPKIALDGGPDGLTLYRKLLPQIKGMLEANSLLLLEAAPPTIEALKSLAQSAFPHFAISVGHDYAGLARYIKVTTPAL